MGLNATQKKERSTFLEDNLVITECSQRKPYVFVSYASDDWETVFKSAVVPLQKEHGLRVYADKAFDTVNDKWIVPMLRNVRGADMLVAFVSQSYIESYACFLELLTAVNGRKQIVFVSLGDRLRLGDTTDQPEIERGVKNEILNQGSNLATMTNNTSNDVMRAMKSAYTSLSTLLEQDALSKYDISDAFINFFRDASVNQKTIRDLGAVIGTIESISGDVLDPSLIAGPVHMAEPATAVPEPASPREAQAEACAEQGIPVRTEAAYEHMEIPETRAGAEQAAAGRDGEPPARPGTEAAGPMRRFAEAWKSDSPKLALAGIVAGLLGLVFAFFVVTALLAIPCCVFGFVCGLKGLKSEKKALPVAALILNGGICAFIIFGIVLVMAEG